MGCADGNDFLAVDGYVLFRRDRSATGQGGGVCIYVKEVFHASVEEQYSHADIELLWIRIPATKHSHSFLIGCIYRPSAFSVAFWPLLESILEGAVGERSLCSLGT